MPGAPLFRRTAAHARHKTSLRRTLSYSAWNLRPGSALAARYSACCKARTGSAGTLRPDPEAAGLAPLVVNEVPSQIKFVHFTLGPARGR